MDKGRERKNWQQPECMHRKQMSMFICAVTSSQDLAVFWSSDFFCLESIFSV